VPVVEGEHDHEGEGNGRGEGEADEGINEGEVWTRRRIIFTWGLTRFRFGGGRGLERTTHI